MTLPVTSNLVLHLDSSVGVTYDGSNKVSYWTDQSGIGNHFQQTNSTYQPTYQASSNIAASVPSIVFNGAQRLDCVLNSLFKNVAAAHIFYVVRLSNDTTNNQQMFFYHQDGINSAARFQCRCNGASNSNRVVLGGKRLDADAFNSYYPTSGTWQFVKDKNYLLQIRSDWGSSRYIYMRNFDDTEIGGSVYASAGNTSNTDANPGIYIGARPDYTSGLYAEITEIFVYNALLTSAQLEDINDYLRDKYLTYYKTVGSGGDFADWDAAMQWLENEEPISGAYSFGQISDLTQTSFTDPGGILHTGTPHIRINGNRYVTTLSAVTGIKLESGSSNGLVVVIHDVVIKITGTSNVSGIKVLARTAFGTEIYDNYVYSVSDPNGTTAIEIGFAQVTDGGYFKIFNNVIFNCKFGIACGAVMNDAGTYTGRRFIENCSIVNCGETASGYAVQAGGNLNVGYIAVTNVHVLRNDGITGKDVLCGDSSGTFDNCAASDTSTFADLEATYPGMTTNCIDALSAADNLKSLVFGVLHFLRPKYVAGTGIYNGGIIPSFATEDYAGDTYDSPYPIGAYDKIVSIVTYNGNGEDSGSPPSDNNLYENGDYAIIAGGGTLVKAGYVLGSWNTAADGSGTDYDEGDTMLMGYDDVTLYAQWILAPASVKRYLIGVV